MCSKGALPLAHLLVADAPEVGEVLPLVEDALPGLLLQPVSGHCKSD